MAGQGQRADDRPSTAGAAQASARRRQPRFCGGEVPVEQLVDHSIDVRGAPVLVVEVVRVLPHVDGEQRLLALGERHFGVGRLHDLEGAAVEDEPAPARAELRLPHRRRQLLLEFVVAAERGVDHLRELARRLAAAVALQLLPVERVVPRLRGVVEQRRLVGLARGLVDDLLERRALVLGALDEIVQIVDVGLVMLAVVEADIVFAEMTGSSAFSA